MKALQTGLALVGLLVGAGFATGKEVTQYFIGFGLPGLWGVVLAAVVTSLAAMFALTAGCYFLAEEHATVFRQISHPIISKVMDIGATVTQFAIGFIMIAGAGAAAQQQFHVDLWVGALAISILVALAGLLDVDKVSKIIGAVTPLIVLLICVLFIWIVANRPEGNFSDWLTVAKQTDTPVKPWFLSAVNYAGMQLATGISMILVIGGDSTNMRNAARGGVVGGMIFGSMMIVETLTLVIAAPIVAGSDVPILTLSDHVAPWFSQLAGVIVLLMIFNTALGMFYALGRRLTAPRPRQFKPVFLAGVAGGFAVSFVGFGGLTAVVFPILGYIGMLIGIALIAWRIKSARRIELEERNRSALWSLLMAPGTAHKRDSLKISRLIRGTAPSEQRYREVLRQDMAEESQSPSISARAEGD